MPYREDERGEVASLKLETKLFYLHPKKRWVSPTALPSDFCQARSWMKPLKGARPVPGPIMITGV